MAPQVSLRPAQVLEDRRVLLSLRKQLNLSDNLSTAQLRLLYGTAGANPGDKRRLRVLQLLSEVEQKMGVPSVETDELTVPQLLERAVKVADRVQLTSSTAAVDKWQAEAVASSVPRAERQPELTTPWKEHVAAQERIGHVNSWSGSGGGEGGAAGASAASVCWEAVPPKSSELTADRASETIGHDSGGSDGSGPEEAAEEAEPEAPETTTAVIAKKATTAAVVSQVADAEPEAPPTLKRGRVAVWRANDAAQKVVDQAREIASLEQASVIGSRSPSKRSSAAGSAKGSGKGVSARLYPGPSLNGGTSKRLSLGSGAASLGSLTAASVNSPQRSPQRLMPKRAGGKGSLASKRTTASPQSAATKSSPARKIQLSALEQTLAALAAEADELLTPTA